MISLHSQIYRFITGGGLRASNSASTLPGALHVGDPQSGSHLATTPPKWVGRLHDSEKRRGKSGRTAAEQIVFFEKVHRVHVHRVYMHRLHVHRVHLHREQIVFFEKVREVVLVGSRLGLG